MDVPAYTNEGMYLSPGFLSPGLGSETPTWFRTLLEAPRRGVEDSPCSLVAQVSSAAARKFALAQKASVRVVSSRRE